MSSLEGYSLKEPDRQQLFVQHLGRLRLKFGNPAQHDERIVTDTLASYMSYHMTRECPPAEFVELADDAVSRYIDQVGCGEAELASMTKRLIAKTNWLAGYVIGDQYAQEVEQCRADRSRLEE